MPSPFGSLSPGDVAVPPASPFGDVGQDYLRRAQQFAYGPVNNLLSIPQRAWQAANPQYLSYSDSESPQDTQNRAMGGTALDMLSLAAPSSVARAALSTGGPELGALGSYPLSNRGIWSWDELMGRRLSNARAQEFMTDWFGSPNWHGSLSRDFGSLGVDAELQDQWREPMAYAKRMINPNTNAAYHTGFTVEPEYQGAAMGPSIGKDLMAHNVDLYRRQGIDDVGVTAGDQVGGYAWARYGFVPYTSSWDGLKQDLYHELYGLGSRISSADRAAMEKILQSDDPKAVWNVADYRAPVRGQRDPLGKHLLLGQSWGGKMDLHDPDVLDRFYNYVGDRALR